MYLSFVLVAFKFIRTSFIVGRILYVHLEEAPDVDKLLELIDQIVLARELKDFWLEEELFAKLIFILRCPEVLFYMTRMRKINPVKSYRRTRRRVAALLNDSNYDEEEEEHYEEVKIVAEPDKSLWGKFKNFELPSQFSRVARAAHAALDKLDIGKSKKDQ